MKIRLARDLNKSYIGDPKLRLDEQGTLFYVDSYGEEGAPYDVFVSVVDKGARPRKEILDGLVAKNLIKIG